MRTAGHFGAHELHPDPDVVERRWSAWSWVALVVAIVGLGSVLDLLGAIP